MDFPRMKGSARMAVGAGDFDVPLFSQIGEKLWTGCSPAEFPDEWEEFDYNWLDPRRPSVQEPVNCHWLTIPVGHTPEIRIPRFQRILNLYPWSLYAVPEGTLMATAELRDSVDLSPQEEIDRLAYKVIEWLEHDYTVLVHCQAGLNRSALVAARVLMLHSGMSADDAINLVREKRSPMCLCNRHFERFLRELDGSVLLG